MLLVSFSLFDLQAKDKSSYSWGLDYRDPFKKGLTKADKELEFMSKLRKALKITGIVKVGGVNKGIFSTGLHKVGDQFRLKVEDNIFSVKIISLDLKSITAVIELNNKQYKISKFTR